MKPKKLKFSEEHYKTNDIIEFDTIEEYNKTLEKNVLHFYLRHKKIDSVDKLLELHYNLKGTPEIKSDNRIFHLRQPLRDDIILVCDKNVAIISILELMKTDNGCKLGLATFIFKHCVWSKYDNELRYEDYTKETFEGVDDRMIHEIIRPTKIASFLDSEEE